MRANPHVVLRGDHNECAGCGQLFNSVRAFEKHRIGDFGKDRRCATIQEMIANGMSCSSTGWWITESREMTDSSSGSDARINDQEAA